MAKRRKDPGRDAPVELDEERLSDVSGGRGRLVEPLNPTPPGPGPIPIPYPL